MTKQQQKRWSAALFLIVGAMLMVGCLARTMKSLDEALVGTWHGESKVTLPVTFVPPKRTEPTNVVTRSLSIDITIHADGSVMGHVGGAELVDSVLKSNRGELGRKLNIASDFIIMDGYLAGPVVAEDEVDEKEFTIPFNIVDGELHGSIMWLEGWKYPRPLVEVDLVKAD